MLLLMFRLKDACITESSAPKKPADRMSWVAASLFGGREVGDG